MQRITKFSAIIGFLAVLTFAVGFFMFTPSFHGHSLTMGAVSAFAWDGNAGGGCCGGGGGGGNFGGGGNGGFNPPPPPPPPQPAPNCALDAAPTTIDRGQSATLSWSTSNAGSVSINQGIGGVSRNGSTSVSPQNTTTYTLTASGNGRTVTCSKTITVRIPVPDPVCTLDAAPTTINHGQSATLTWTSSNASSVSFNQGIGAENLNGSRAVSPTQNTTYTLTATGNGKTVTCSKTITVIPPTPDPVCTLDAAPTTINHGQSATLTWTTQNASSVSFNQGIGAENLNGSRAVSPTQTTTYTLTATGNGKTVTCSKTINVNPVVQNLSCDAFYATPANLGRGGGNTTLIWNTTGATSVSIDQGVGSVSVDGSQGITVNESKTFTLTANDGNGHTVTCQTPVSVETGGGGGGGGSSSPRCDYFRASDKTISAGEAVTLSWKTRRGTSLEISPDVIDTTNKDKVKEGSVIVRPTKDTTYKLTVKKGSRKHTCDVKIDVTDSVKVTSVRDREPLTSVELKYVPYTGFDAGPMITGFFYTLLALWSLGVAYVLVVKQSSVFGFNLAMVGLGRRNNGYTPVVVEEAPRAVARVAAYAPANLPVATEDDEDEEEEDEEVEEEETEEDFSSLENHAYKSSVMLSKDAMKVIVAAADTTDARIALLDTVIARAKGTYPREDGWISLNRERIAHLF